MNERDLVERLEEEGTHVDERLGELLQEATRGLDSDQKDGMLEIAYADHTYRWPAIWNFGMLADEMENREGWLQRDSFETLRDNEEKREELYSDYIEKVRTELDTHPSQAKYE